MAKTEMKLVGVWVPEILKKYIDSYLVNHPFYRSISDFGRDALIEKIKRDSPQFYNKMMTEIDSQFLTKEEQ